ncbi:branched-chain amino acid ABC transporter substrate-binding protein [Ectobacillus sp. JY-23]|uniref:branched-chain amino acid ABC transporter substrate-binding protein n=1 Tax=Ectobacillus sp. JY-23 TaxID=2933872 RepID=UPI001FF19621|nr:branched-chain amino acid ABC transporter substrate-binding protein [Ectobacillus sp. JY-23]UOY93220.1 branched-chain amino acid ABC transporter substrate-binding protein [Ectobacillus sp. JY-23]
MTLKKGMALVLSTSLFMGILAGCGSKQSEPTAGTSGSGDSKVIKIVTQSPLSGASATQGEAIKLGAQLKLEEQKEEFKKLGFELQLVPYDDQADPKKGVANAQLVGADKAVLGVVGHLNSGVAIPSSEVYEKNNLVMVSPVNTATDVTDRKLKSVNRICARDDFQGPAGATHAVKTLNAKNIFVIDDKTAYGTGLAKAFEQAVEKEGGKILGHESITVGEKDFNGVLNKVLAKKPDLIYFGGLYAEAGLLVKQARDKGLDIPIMGGDGIDSSSLVEIAGTTIKNTYYTSIAADPMKSESGKKFAETYKKKFGKEVEGYSAYGYDAAGVLLEGLKTAIKDNGNKLPTREQVRDAVRKTSNYEGAVTKVGFDEKGDNKYSKVYIYKFNEQKYPGKQEGEIENK